MTIYQEEGAKLRRSSIQKAIDLAMQNRWEEAVQVNQAILELFPNDVDALNRLGKSLTELGKYDEAKDAYRRALGIDPLNTIAQKNLSRLAHMDPERPVKEDTVKASPRVFIEERGKAGVTALLNLAHRATLLKVFAGDQVSLAAADGVLRVETPGGQYLGQVETKLGIRLMRLMQGGNRYVAAVTSVSDHEVRVIIRETYQHPSLVGKVSFPTTGPEEFRAYTREGVLKYDLEEEEGLEEEEEEPGMDEESDTLPEGFSVVEGPGLVVEAGEPEEDLLRA
ncbi:MAG: tetratricopeptide repeat protein [Chloroflexi bacterium]|nr:tetratricopeptide repeat protein [Chloroflexota bacterium]